MFGFLSINELLHVIILKSLNSFLTVYISILAFCTALIESHVYETAEAYYFLLSLYAIDFITGVVSAIKLKKFNSRNFPRVAVSVLGMSIMLFISFNAAKYNIMFSFLPSLLYAVFLSQNLISITENLFKLKMIDSELFGFVTKKFSFQSILKHFKQDVKDDQEQPKNNI